MGEFAWMECPDCGARLLTYATEYHCVFCHNTNLKPQEFFQEKTTTRQEEIYLQLRTTEKEIGWIYKALQRVTRKLGW